MKYNTLHQRVRVLYGKPSLCEHCGTTDAKAYDWANISGKYTTIDRSDWKRLCRKCHIEFDGISEYTKKAILMIQPNGSRIKYASLRLASDTTGINYKSISNVINGRARSAGGYGWRLVKGV